MTARAVRPGPEVRQRLADAVGALRLLVVVGLVVDAASVFWYLRSSGVAAAAVTAAQLVLTAAAAAAVLWLRPRLAVVLCAVVVLLALVVGATSEELWLLAVVAVTVAARARPRVVVAVAGAQLGYVVLFALQGERRSDGWGVRAAVIAAALCLVGYAVGLLVRRSLRLGVDRQGRLLQLEQENEEIRAAERLRLADDLQTVVTGGLGAIGRQLDVLAAPTADARALRRGLDEIERESRAVLAELRALLEVLRREPDPTGAVPSDPAHRPRRWFEVVSARHVRLAAAATFALLAVRTVLVGGGEPLAPGWTVQALGWVACAVAVHRPRAAAAVAVAALAVSLATGMPSSWSALPTVVLFFLAALRAGVRLLWLVLTALLGLGALVVAVVPDWAVPLTTTGYAGMSAVVGGLAWRHFLDLGRDSAERRADLLDERERLEAGERAAMARDLHDVVAHQLSLTNLAIMGTSASTDPVVLAGTVRRVAESVEAADRELSHLLHALRGDRTDQVHASPLVLPSAGAASFARRLTASGFAPVVEIDPAADDLDATTMRTLGRIMQEATTNILRYAPGGSRCRYLLAVVDDHVLLRVTSPLPGAGAASALSLGWGLRGVAERVELSHGTFHAGPQDHSWTVEVTLPRARDFVAATVLAG